VVADDAVDDVEPYMENFTCPERYNIFPHCPFSDAYMHLQFKAAVAVPPSNDIDIFPDDVGFIALVHIRRHCGYNPRSQMTDFVNLPYIVD